MLRQCASRHSERGCRSKEVLDKCRGVNTELPKIAARNVVVGAMRRWRFCQINLTDLAGSEVIDGIVVPVSAGLRQFEAPKSNGLYLAGRISRNVLPYPSGFVLIQIQIDQAIDLADGSKGCPAELVVDCACGMAP